MANTRSLAICEGLTGLHSLLARVRLCVKTNGTGMRRALRPLASLAAASNTFGWALIVYIIGLGVCRLAGEWDCRFC